MNLGESLKFLRQYYGYNQKHVADNVGVGVSAYSQYENNLRQPNYSILKKLTEFYSVSYDFLFKDYDNVKDDNFTLFEIYINMYKDSVIKAHFLDKKLKECDKNGEENYQYLIYNLIEVESKHNKSLEMCNELGYSIENVTDIFDKYL